MLHKAAADILWLGNLPTRIIGGTVNIMLLGGVMPHLYPPVPSYITLSTNTKFNTKKCQLESCKTWAWSHKAPESLRLRHSHLGTKGDMGRGCHLLGFYCRVRSRSYQGHFKVKPAIILNKNIFLQFPYILFQRSIPQGCSWHIVAGKLSKTHPRGYSDYTRLGGVIPHSYIIRPLLYHTLYQR